jgi:hypothetical protein
MIGTGCAHYERIVLRTARIGTRAIGRWLASYEPNGSHRRASTVSRVLCGRRFHRGWCSVICEPCAKAADLDKPALHEECEAPETCPCHHKEKSEYK